MRTPSPMWPPSAPGSRAWPERVVHGSAAARPPDPGLRRSLRPRCDGARSARPGRRRHRALSVHRAGPPPGLIDTGRRLAPRRPAPRPACASSARAERALSAARFYDAAARRADVVVTMISEFVPQFQDCRAPRDRARPRSSRRPARRRYGPSSEPNPGPSREICSVPGAGLAPQIHAVLFQAFSLLCARADPTLRLVLTGGGLDGLGGLPVGRGSARARRARRACPEFYLDPRPPSSSPASTRASAFRRSRRWRRDALWRRRAPVRFPRSAPTRLCSSMHASPRRSPPACRRRSHAVTISASGDSPVPDRSRGQRAPPPTCMSTDWRRPDADESPAPVQASRPDQRAREPAGIYRQTTIGDEECGRAATRAGARSARRSPTRVGPARARRAAARSRAGRCRSSRRPEQVDDDPGEPRGDQLGAERGLTATASPAHDLDDPDRVHRVRRRCPARCRRSSGAR